MPSDAQSVRDHSISPEVDRIAANLGRGLAPTVQEGLDLLGRIMWYRAENADLHRVLHPDDEEWCAIRKDRLERLEGVVNHIAGMRVPELGEEYGQIPAQMVLDARAAQRGCSS